MTITALSGQTILVVEDEPLILMDLKSVLQRAGARVVVGARHTEDAALSGAVLDRADTATADRLAERGLPFVFYSGRKPTDFARWPRAPVLSKPAGAHAVLDQLTLLLPSDRAAKTISAPAMIAPADLLITHALHDRRIRPNSRVLQVRAFHDLTELVMRSPRAGVQRFLELAVELCAAGSAGWSRLGHNAAGEEVFSWDALAGAFAPHVGGTTPRHFSPSGLCLDAGKTVLVARPARVFTYFDEVDVPIAEALIVPVYDTNGTALGTIWVVHHDETTFDASDARVIEELAVQLVLALKLLGDAKAHDEEIANKLALIQDTDHRVKNTIQSVASLLMLHARACKLPEARAAIEEAGARLGIFGTVHELLHGKGDDSRAIDIGHIIEKLADALQATGTKRITLRVHADHVLLEPRIALPLSLLVNEAITNAYKHAYPGDRTGEILVRVARAAGNGLSVGIQDEGVGFSPEATGGLGLALIRSFAAQVDGRLTIESDDGTSIHLTIEEAIGTRAQSEATPASPNATP